MDSRPSQCAYVTKRENSNIFYKMETKKDSNITKDGVNNFLSVEIKVEDREVSFNNLKAVSEEFTLALKNEINALDNLRCPAENLKIVFDSAQDSAKDLQMANGNVKNSVDSLQVALGSADNSIENLHMAFGSSENSDKNLQVVFGSARNSVQNIQSAFSSIRNSTENLKTAFGSVQNSAENLEMTFCSAKSIAEDLTINKIKVKNKDTLHSTKEKSVDLTDRVDERLISDIKNVVENLSTNTEDRDRMFGVVKVVSDVLREFNNEVQLDSDKNSNNKESFEESLNKQLIYPNQHEEKPTCVPGDGVGSANWNKVLPQESEALSLFADIESKESTKPNGKQSTNVDDRPSSTSQQNDALFQCEKCKEQFTSFADCEIHTVSCTRVLQLKLELKVPRMKDKHFQCQQCSYFCKTSSDFNKHKRVHTGEKPYKCSDCEYASSTSSDLKKHFKVHNSEKPYKCIACDYSSSRTSDLKRHLKVHTGEKPILCCECDYSTTTLVALRKHMRVHTGEKPYTCHLCNYSASAFCNLKIHLRRHTGEKPYKCTHCDYSAAQLTHLKQHRRIHTGEKPFKCQYCDYYSAVYSNLKIHLRKHTGEKPYQCSECDYSAAQLVHLKLHSRVHTGENPFKCTECEYAGTTHNGFKKHLKIHALEKRFTARKVKPVKSFGIISDPNFKPSTSHPSLESLVFVGHLEK